ncbi:8433_t:CDS:1, partial [Ambispora gerdemannii]
AKCAMNEIKMAKAIIPTVLLNMLNKSMQVHGAAGVSGDTYSISIYIVLGRTLRLADRPDEIHIQQIRKLL